MNIIRKIIGLFIIFCIGIPVLIGIIWTAGISNAALSPEFYIEVPKKIIQETPALLDELINEMKDDWRISDPNTKQWLEALAKNDIKILDVINQSGIKEWLENEVAYKTGLIGEMLKGEISIQEIRLDLIPLKEALRSPIVREYIVNTLKNLPECANEQLEEWAEAISFPKGLFDLPACQPTEPEKAIMALAMFDDLKIDDIPDSVPMVENPDDKDLRFLPLRINIFKLTMFFIYLLFIFPIGVIFTGALIAGDKSRWFGVGLSLSALFSYVLVKLSFGFTEWIGFFVHQEHYLDATEEIVINKVFSLITYIFEPLSRNIESLSGIIFLAGLAFFAFSFYKKKKESPTPQVEATPDPAVEEEAKPKEQEEIKEEEPKDQKM